MVYSVKIDHKCVKVRRPALLKNEKLYLCYFFASAIVIKEMALNEAWSAILGTSENLKTKKKKKQSSE